ncbi:MAG: M1 family metallopeptidase [Saprospiraceae bacterium]|nr:M1 family metallopeptidase [Saprospiraceae bacterium]
MRILLLVSISILCSMCTSEKAPSNPIFIKYQNPDRKDHHSFSEPDKAIVTHLDLNVEVDFDKREISGVAQYDILSNDADRIVFDTRDLQISKVVLNGTDETHFELGPMQTNLGSPLEVSIKDNTETVAIYYTTSPQAAALQWLSPEQTTEKKLPFLFTQGQAILTRSWIPCQDSPGIRITYNATVKVPSEMLAVMSASNPQERNTTGVYEFEMAQAIPSYLIALAVGDLTFGEIGKRTGVYAEPSMLDKSLYEFADMEKMLESAEALYGPYLWDRYDVIVLPASFPFGGMENPRLTFATPTIIAGDRSLTALIAHELAHSWSGNLVTNATWDDFWLNEGFTVYFERRIMEALYGEDYASMLAVLGYQDLEADVEDFGHSHADTHLKLDLKGRDPDDGMTDIAYEKGAYFLGMLESKVGKESFDKFLTQYFDDHKFQTISTSEFIDYLNDKLLNQIDEDINIDAWIFGPGIPDDVVQFESDKFEIVDKAVKAFIESRQLKQYDWSTHEWLHFIRHLPTTLNLAQMAALDSYYDFTNSGNSEIAAAWYELSINTGYFEENIDQIRSFLVKVGRRKFLTPLYRAFKEAGQLELARDIYKEAKPNYHSVSTQTMDALLEV